MEYVRCRLRNAIRTRESNQFVQRNERRRLMSFQMSRKRSALALSRRIQSLVVRHSFALKPTVPHRNTCWKTCEPWVRTRRWKPFPQSELLRAIITRAATMTTATVAMAADEADTLETTVDTIAGNRTAERTDTIVLARTPKDTAAEG